MPRRPEYPRTSKIHLRQDENQRSKCDSPSPLIQIERHIRRGTPQIIPPRRARESQEKKLTARRPACSCNDRNSPYGTRETIGAWRFDSGLWSADRQWGRGEDRSVLRSGRGGQAAAQREFCRGPGLAEERFIEPFCRNAPGVEVIYERGILEKSAKKCGKRKAKAPTCDRDWNRFTPTLLPVSLAPSKLQIRSAFQITKELTA